MALGSRLGPCIRHDLADRIPLPARKKLRGGEREGVEVWRTTRACRTLKSLRPVRRISQACHNSVGGTAFEPLSSRSSQTAAGDPSRSLRMRAVATMAPRCWEKRRHEGHASARDEAVPGARTRLVASCGVGTLDNLCTDLPHPRCVATIPA